MKTADLLNEQFQTEYTKDQVGNSNTLCVSVLQGVGVDDGQVHRLGAD